MSTSSNQSPPPVLALERFEPHPNVFYSLDGAAHLAGVTRRSLLIYCRAGLVQPVFQPPYGVITFSEEAVLLIRRIERVRTARGIDMAWIRQMFELLEELNRLRSEVRFLRQNG